MLDGLFVTPAVTAITEALAAIDRGKRDAAPAGTLAVVGNAKLAGALAAGRDVLPVGLSARAAKKLPRTVPDLSAVEPASLAAVIGVDVSTADDWQATLAAWSRVVRDGGAIILVDRGHPHDASRRALCAGLTEIEQRHAGRSIITSGLVSHL
jgi:hypothetical protein